MDLGSPVMRNPTGRSRHTLVDRMTDRRHQRRPALIELIRLITPEPVLTGLEAGDDRMPGRGRVLTRMLRRRGVTASDVPALSTPSQVHPPATGRIALDAAGAAGRHARVDPRYRRHLASSSSPSRGDIGSRTKKRVLPGSEVTRRSPWCRFTTMRHEISSPSPVPWPTGLVVKNGSKIRSWISAGIPGPVSANSTTT